MLKTIHLIKIFFKRSLYFSIYFALKNVFSYSINFPEFHIVTFKNGKIISISFENIYK